MRYKSMMKIIKVIETVRQQNYVCTSGFVREEDAFGALALTGWPRALGPALGLTMRVVALTRAGTSGAFAACVTLLLVFRGDTWTSCKAGLRDAPGCPCVAVVGPIIAALAEGNALLDDVRFLMAGDLGGIDIPDSQPNGPCGDVFRLIHSLNGRVCACSVFGMMGLA